MRRRLHGDRGNVALLVVILMPALLMAAGLVLDGGRKLQVRRDASAAASAAARAAVQLSDMELYGRRLDPHLAASRAEGELARQGLSGSASVSGEVVTVTATASVDFLILPGGSSVSATATADALIGVTSGG